MTMQNLLLIIIFLIIKVQGIWPPSYKINLTHEEIFVISEELTSDDVNDVYEAEDEMIKEEELKRFNLESDSKKYLRLHQLTLRRNNENVKKNQPLYNKQSLIKPRESNYEDFQPWVGGFVDKNGDLKPVGKIIYDPKNVMKEETKTEKNQERREVSNKDYNYDSLRAEYYGNIKSVKVSNETLHYTEIKEEESFKDAVKAIVGDTKKPKNCTAEEKKGIGLAAAECFWADLHNRNLNQKERSGIFRRIMTIICVWIFVYLLVAIPCWCQKGWCCCCFQCKFCKPQERIDVAKKYLMDNPVGVYHTPDNEKLSYTPTSYEKYAQNKLEKALLKL